ncbi:hypothetical protein TNCV_3621691 [Trichonephila clavipes]|nr:hypothetical protein TNCV_3621691 [Trichonephila clavipes]
MSNKSDLLLERNLEQPNWEFQEFLLLNKPMMFFLEQLTGHRHRSIDEWVIIFFINDSRFSLTSDLIVESNSENRRSATCSPMSKKSTTTAEEA